MSAFIVEKSTINKIITYIKQECLRNSLLEQKVKQFPEIASWDQLAQAMYDMNKEAVNYRYNEENEKKSIKFTPELYESKVCVYKSLQCFLYQCNEGKVPEKTLYKFLDDVILQYLANSIVTGLTEYDQAEWN